MLSPKQKLIRDKKLAELDLKIASKQAEIDKITKDRDADITKIQADKEEVELIKTALENLK